MNLPRAEWEKRRYAWQRAMVKVANAVGNGSKLYQAMGSLAWGRYDGEPSAADSKDRAVFGTGYLQGKRDALLSVARMEGWPGAVELENIHLDITKEINR